MNDVDIMEKIQETKDICNGIKIDVAVISTSVNTLSKSVEACHDKIDKVLAPKPNDNKKWIGVTVVTILAAVYGLFTGIPVDKIMALVNHG